MYSIEQKVALVTGSSAGLGKALARQLLMDGARVVLNGRDPQKLKRAASEMEELGFEVSTVKGDITSPGDCREIIDHCVASFGRLDILVSNAGVSSGGKFEDTSPDTFRRVFEVNTLGTIHITQSALPHIRESSGSIVFISSLAGLVGLPFSSLYSSSKMALTAIAQALQVELNDSDVHVGIAYVGFLRNGPDKRVVGPAGELQPVGDRTSFRLQSMDRASKIIVRMIRRRKRKAVMSLMGKLVYPALRFTPWIIRYIIRRSKEKAQRTYEPVN